MSIVGGIFMLFFKSASKGKTEIIERIPGIEPNGAETIKLLGFKKVSELKKQDAEELYYSLCSTNKSVEDKTILYQLRCAIYYATVKTPDPKKLHWWYWKDSDANETLISDEELFQIYGNQKNGKGM